LAFSFGGVVVGGAAWEIAARRRRGHCRHRLGLQTAGIAFTIAVAAIAAIALTRLIIAHPTPPAYR
jgi:hypothetical protein